LNYANPVPEGNVAGLIHAMEQYRPAKDIEKFGAESEEFIGKVKQKFAMALLAARKKTFENPKVRKRGDKAG